MPVPVAKTYKLFIAGKFPRSESGRSYTPASHDGINVARGSKKDVRDAVQAARAALPGWSASAAYLRGQILYRLAEMIASRRDAVQAELRLGGASAARARQEVDTALSLTTWYAGLCDKLQQLLGSQNAVQGPFFDFSTVEPTGVVGAVAPAGPALVGTLALVLPLLAAGNSVVGVVSEADPFAGLALGELCASSDVPAGVVNLVAGPRQDLVMALAQHRDVDGLLLAGAPEAAVSAAAADNCKRVRWADLPPADWRRAERLRSLTWVEPFVEVKTLWHPIAP